MKRMKIIIALTLLATGGQGAHAAYEDVGVGARVVGLGNAFTAMADDVYSIYYNPAGLGTLERPMVATSYSRLLTGLSDNSNLQNSFLAFERPIKDGRYGAWGAAWNFFSLSGLYREMSLYTSYGRQIFPDRVPNGLFAGISMKYLRRSLGDVAAADNSFTNTGQVQIGVADPVLQAGAQSNIDFDLGFLYRIRPRWSAGLAIQHLFEPNIAFSDSDNDPLGRNIKLGLAYQTPWTSIASELALAKAPDRSTDKIFTIAAEKWLPTLMYGTFGIRSSIGVGSRDYRQMTAGLSYRIYRMQFDYGFSIPLGTISGTFGNHRMGVSFHFGRPRGSEPQLAEAILENLRELADVGTPEFRAQAEQLALYKRTAQQEFLRQARVDTGEGRFSDAKQKLQQALSLNKKDKRIQGSLGAVGLVASIFPEVRNFRTDPAQAALYEGIMDYIADRNREALRKLAYAQSLAPANERIEDLLQAIEGKAGLQRERQAEERAKAAPTLGREKVVGATMALMEVALRESDYDRVLKLAEEVLELDPTNVLAWKRKATALYAQKNYEPALRALRAALKFERRSEERKRLKSYIDAMIKLIRKKAEGTKPKIRRGPKVQPGATGRGAGRKRVSPLEMQRMYEAGVDLYAQGQLSEAARMFQRILDLDPKNKPAARALRRVQTEILQGGR